MKPMKVVSATESGIRCKHKDFSGIGWFHADECVWPSSQREDALYDLQHAMNEVSRLKLELFSE